MASLLSIHALLLLYNAGIQKFEMRQTMDHVASVPSIVVLIVIRTGQLVGTGRIAQHAQIR